MWTKQISVDTISVEPRPPCSPAGSGLVAEAVEPGPSSARGGEGSWPPEPPREDPAQCLADSSLEYFIHLVRQWASVRRLMG